MSLLLSLGAFGVVALLAAMSPGPDFLVVSKNSIGQSRKVGVMTALGVAAGNCVHVTYTVIGIGLIIASSIVVFSAIKIAGAIYLVYLGVNLMTDKSNAVVVDAEPTELLTSRAAFRQGFFTNVLNPKATLFFVAVFSQFVSPSLPFAVRTLFGVEAVTVIGLWLVILAVILTFPAVRKVIGKVQDRALKFMGAALLLLGVKVALTSN